MNILALLGALAIGITLGLLGSGGSILTVPVLVFLLDQSEKTAIAGSLAIVGSIAFIAALPYMRQRLVEWRSVLLFGLPSMLGTVAGAWAAQFVSGAVQLFVFALVMLVASFTMFRTAPAARGGTDPRARWKEMADGLGVGMLTGLVGVGGGFLIVPALVLLGGLAMSRAVATSLVIIALNSAIGFWKHSHAGVVPLDPQLIALFIAVGAAGSLVGSRLGAKLPQATLKRGFALFLIPMAAFIIWRTLPRIL